VATILHEYCVALSGQPVFLFRRIHF